MWLAVLVMFALGILLWRPRARGLLWAGLGMALGALATYLALDLGTAQLVDAAPGGFAGLFEILTSTLLRFLVNALLVMLTLGVALIVAGWLGGATSSGRSVRLAIAGVAHGWGRPMSGGGLGRFASGHPMFIPTLRALVILAAAAALFAVDRLSPSIVAWTALATAIALLAVEVVEGAGLARESQRAGALVARLRTPQADSPRLTSTPLAGSPAAGRLRSVDRCGCRPHPGARASRCRRAVRGSPSSSARRSDPAGLALVGARPLQPRTMATISVGISPNPHAMPPAACCPLRDRSATGSARARTSRPPSASRPSSWAPRRTSG